jgi:hypothetical protein
MQDLQAYSSLDRLLVPEVPVVLVVRRASDWAAGWGLPELVLVEMAVYQKRKSLSQFVFQDCRFLAL